MMALDTTPDEAVLDGATFHVIPTAAGFAIVGDLDVANRASLSNVLDQLVARTGDVELDLARVDFADVATGTLLVSAGRRLSRGRTLILRQPPHQLATVIRLLYPPAVPVRPTLHGLRRDIRLTC